MKRRKNKKLKVSVSLSRLAHAGFGDCSFHKDQFAKMTELYLTRLGISKRLQNTLSIISTALVFGVAILLVNF